MPKIKDSEPPDGGGSKIKSCSYVSQLMDTDEIGVIIKRIEDHTNNLPSQGNNSSQLSTTSLTSANSPVSEETGLNQSPQQHVHSNRENSTNLTNKFSNRFELSDSGPFIVMLESNNENIGKLHPMSIGKLLLVEHKELDNFIQSITNAGKNRVKVTFKSAYHANSLLNSKVLEQKDIKTYIPQYLTKRFGIIRGVDFSLTDEEIKTMISPLTGQFFTVVDAQRLKRKIVVDGKDPEYKPTGSIKIAFKGQRLPSSISLCKVICDVEPFIYRVVQCYNCLRYGHVSNQCKSKIRCAKCGNEHKTTDCSSGTPPSCIFCQGRHSSSDHNLCPEFKKQKKIKTIMANENLSYREAITKVDNSFSTAVQSPIVCTPEDFPSLYETRKRKKGNSTPRTPSYIPENIHQDHTGNGVCLLSNGSQKLTNDIPTIIEKLVDTFMHLYKSKNINPTHCEAVIKNIIHPLIVSNKTNT